MSIQLSLIRYIVECASEEMNRISMKFNVINVFDYDTCIMCNSNQHRKIILRLNVNMWCT